MIRSPRPGKPAKSFLICLFFFVVLLHFGCGPNGGSASVQEQVSGEEFIYDAYRKRQSNLWVEASGVVVRLLPDDVEGSRHQRFIVRMSNGQTLLLSHNIDLAPRISDLKAGDRVFFRGEYEYNDKGGVIHWTHHDPQRRIAGGWIEHQGKRYE